MSDEIKQIINRLEIVARKHTIKVCEDGSKIETMPASVIDELRLNNYSSKLLLDYITNLQQKYEKADYDRHKLFEEKNRLNNIINELEKHLHQEILDWQDANDLWTKAQVQEDKIVLDKLKKLKENNNAKD